MTAVLRRPQIAALVGQPPPTAEQRVVIEAPLGPSLVVAGAGSGKTETMAARVVWLLANGIVEPDQVLGLTFTRKAAGELAERVRKRLRTLARAAAAEGVALGGTVDAARTDGLAGLARPTISTYNSYAASLVSDHALRLGLDPSARLLGEAAQWQLASEVVEAWSDDLDTDAATSTVIEAVLALSGALDEHLLDAAQARSGIEAILEALARDAAGHAAARAVRRGQEAAAVAGGARARPRPRRRVPHAASAPPTRSTSATRSRSPRGSRSTCPRSAPASGSGSGWCCSTSTRTRPTRS